MKKSVAFDIEVYPNYVLVVFKRVEDSKTSVIVLDSKEAVIKKNDKKVLDYIIKNCELIGFNSMKYDLPILNGIAEGLSVKEIKTISNRIVNDNVFWWQLYNIDFREMTKMTPHIDLINVVPGVRISLKTLAGRIHFGRLESLPYAPDTELTGFQKRKVKEYCFNDVDITIELFKMLKEPLKLRKSISEEYGINAMSKGDAQISEAVFKKQTGVYNPDLKLVQKKFFYMLPEYCRFKSESLKIFASKFDRTAFEVNDDYKIDAPDFLQDKLILDIEGFKAKCGIGGLHSCEKNTHIKCEEGEHLINIDVSSYYPSILVNRNLKVESLGNIFLDLYKSFIEKRLEAKRTYAKSGNKKYKEISEAYKVLINGTFGKLNSKFSIFYSPQNFINIVLTGQMSLLYLVENMIMAGVKVVSANTDGILCFADKDTYEKIHSEADKWAGQTNFSIDIEYYTDWYAKDVNNYFMFNRGRGTEKLKGVFTKDSLMKNPQGAIIYDAVKNELKGEKTIADTVYGCYDVRRFVHVRKVKGGALYREKPIGDVVRWVYAKDGDTIHYAENGNKVPKTDMSVPVQNFSPKYALPPNIDLERYAEEASKLHSELMQNNMKG